MMTDLRTLLISKDDSHRKNWNNSGFFYLTLGVFIIWKSNNRARNNIYDN